MPTPAEREPKQPRRYCLASRPEPLEFNIINDPQKRQFLDARVTCECGVNVSQRFGPFLPEHTSLAIPNVQSWQDKIPCPRRLPFPPRT